MFYQSGYHLSQAYQYHKSKQGNYPGKIFISNVKYLKWLRIYSTAVNIEISGKFPLVSLCQVSHWSGGKSYFDTRMNSKLLCLHSNAQNLMYFVVICHYLCYINLKGLFPIQKSLRGRERQRLSTINVLLRIQNFTMVTIKSAENSL